MVNSTGSGSVVVNSENVPAVSVVLPIYNGEAFLGDTLDSLRAQTFADFELICVDDGSTDGTAEVLDRYRRHDSRITVLHQENSGAAIARNNGIAAARGRYLAILDSDDIYESTFLEDLYSRAVDCDADIVVCRCDEFDDGSDAYRPYPHSVKDSLLPDEDVFAGVDIDHDAFKLFIGWSWDKIFKTDFVNECGLRFQDLRTSNDMYFVFCAIARAQRISIVDEVLVHHRRGIGGLAETREKSWHCFHDALLNIRRQLQEWGLYGHFERDFVNYCLHASLWNYTTLAEPTKTLLRDKLTAEWFDEFGITGKPRDYFYNANERRKYEMMVASEHPRVSIIVPSLNSIEYYRECIESALCQDMTEIEVICVDAGSEDGTEGLIAQYVRKDPRVRLIPSSVRSYGHQMNLGIDAARGEYMLILESDDYILPNACSYYYRLASENCLDFIKSDHCVFYGDGKDREFEVRQLAEFPCFYDRLWNPSEEETLMHLTILTQPGIYSLDFIRRNEIVYHESPGASYQDNGFWCQVFTQAKRAMFTQETLYMLRRDNPNSSVMSKGKVFAMCDEYDFMRIKLKERGLDRFLGMCAFRRYGNYIFTARRIGDWYRPQFFERFANDFRELERDGELERRYFGPRAWSTLHEIMSHGSDYYYLEWNYIQRAERAERRARSASRDLKKLKISSEKKVSRIKGSKAYRLGSAVAAPLRLFRDRNKLAYRRQESDIEADVPHNPVEDDQYKLYSSLSNEELRDQVIRTHAKRLGCLPDLDHPRSYNEKVLERKLRMCDSDLFAGLADYRRAKLAVEEIIGGRHVKPSLATYNSVSDIDLGSMPSSYTLRCSHGPNIRIDVSDSKVVDREFTLGQLGHWMQTNFAYLNDIDLQYKNCVPAIVVEPYYCDMPDSITAWCFKGDVHFFQYESLENEEPRMSFYDADWNGQPIVYNKPVHETLAERPGYLDDLLADSRKIAGNVGVDHVCIRFDVVNGSYLFSGFDLAPMGGYCRWRFAVSNYLLGERWQ